MRTSAALSLLLVLLVPAVPVLGQQCTRGSAPGQLVPFFGNNMLGYGSTVTIYGDPNARSTSFLGNIATGAAGAWNGACPKGTYPNLPTFQVNFSQAPPASTATAPADHTQILIVFSNDPMPSDAFGITASKWTPAPPGQPEKITLYTQCPPSSSGVKFPQIGCDGNHTQADWSTPGAQIFLEHEIGHVLGLDDVASSCPGVMGDPPSTTATIPSDYCVETNKLNDPAADCNNRPATPGQTQNPCDSGATPPRSGGGPGGRGSGAGGGVCDDYPWVCNDGGPTSWRGSGLACNYACVAVSDDSGNIISDGCGWGCFLADAAPRGKSQALPPAAAGSPLLPASSSPPTGVGGPVLSVTSPTAGQTVSGVINVTGWAMQYFGNALVSVGVDASQASVNLAQGLPSPQSCLAPAGVVNYFCNIYSGFSGTLDTRTLANGAHTLDVAAVSLAGWLTSLEVPFVTANTCFDTIPPTVAVASPANGAAVGGVVPVSVSAADNVAVTQASLYVDGQIVAVWAAPPYTYSWNTAPVAPGAHTLQARAADGCGNTAASPVVHVNVIAPVRLYVDIPAPNASISGTSYGMAGWASDHYGISFLSFGLDGGTLPLTFYKYGVARGDVCNVYPGDPNCPNVGWDASFNTTCFVNGSHTLVVTATDTIGQSGTAYWPVVIANNPAPSASMFWIQPEALAGYGPPGSLIVAGYAYGGSTCGGVQLWWRDVTAGGWWNVVSYQPYPDTSGLWLNAIPNVNALHQYAAYAVYSGATSATCNYPGTNAFHWCP
jgi:Bacterial Ig domain